MASSGAAAASRAQRADRGGVALLARLEGVNRVVGRAVAWLTLATVLICFATVYLRYALGVGLIWLQESYVWTHALVIMLGSGYAFLTGGFIKVDMLYNRMSRRGQAWVNLGGTVVFLAPFVGMILYSGWSFFLSSWRMSERSQFEGGLPALYLLKGTLLLFAVLVAIQGIAVGLRALLILMDRLPEEDTN
jgi:TRAP-type mannitol/chloroaromatic compound transport system permease small subunit